MRGGGKVGREKFFFFGRGGDFYRDMPMTRDVLENLSE